MKKKNKNKIIIKCISILASIYWQCLICEYFCCFVMYTHFDDRTYNEHIPLKTPHICPSGMCVCVCCVCKWDLIRFMMTLEMRTRKSWFLSLLSRFYLHAKCFDQHLCTAMNLCYRLKLPRWEGVAWSVVSINLHCRQAIWSLFEHTSFEWDCKTVPRSVKFTICKSTKNNPIRNAFYWIFERKISIKRNQESSAEPPKTKHH